MSNDFILTENPFFKQRIDKLCLICNCTLKMDQTPHSIFDKLEQTQSQMNVYDALESITNFKEIKIQKQTEKICEFCFVTMSTVIRFCEMCNRSASFLKFYMLYKEMNNKSQSDSINPESCIDIPMTTKLTGANVLSLKPEVLNDYEEQDVKMQVWPKLTRISTVGTLSSTAETTKIEKEEKGTTQIERCAEELCTNEKMLNDEVKQDWKLEIWPESPKITTDNTLNSTYAMFVKEEMIVQEKEITNIETCAEALYPKVKILNEEVEQDVKMEIWPELPAITIGDTLNHKTETPMSEKEETVIQEMKNSSEKEITNIETCLERPTLRTTATSISTDKAIGKGRHEEIIDGIRKVKCNVCSRFYSKSYISQHLRMHSVEKLHSCEICGKTFKHSSTKWTHKLLHKEPQEHVCKVCGKKFTKPRNLREHLIVHSDERPFACEKCGKCFASKNYLRQHMLIHLEEKRHECNVCGKIFHRSCELKEHLNVHSDERPFACEKCGKCFRSKRYRRHHMLSHSEVKRLECHLCGNRFAHRHTLRKHLANNCEGKR